MILNRCSIALGAYKTLEEREGFRVYVELNDVEIGHFQTAPS